MKYQFNPNVPNTSGRTHSGREDSKLPLKQGVQQRYEYAPQNFEKTLFVVLAHHFLPPTHSPQTMQSIISALIQGEFAGIANTCRLAGLAAAKFTASFTPTPQTGQGVVQNSMRLPTPKRSLIYAGRPVPLYVSMHPLGRAACYLFIELR